MARKAKSQTEDQPSRPAINGSFAVERPLKKAIVYTASATQSSDERSVIWPDPTPDVLFHQSTHNNTLLQCISCMEVNIDGTGFFLQNLDGSEADKKDPEYNDVMGFFNEVAPQTSFITLRRTLRFHQESVGWAGMELVRSLDGKLQFLRAIDVRKFKYLKLPQPIKGTVSVVRNGKESKINTYIRPRGMVSSDEGVNQYHSIYGCGAYIDRVTGEWGSNVPMAQRGTEIIIFGAIDNPFSPYHLPRWINQAPSVTGSREAEQLNLEFFESGGIPPMLVTVSGGSLAKKTRDALEKFLNTDKKKQYRAAVLETYATGGSLEGSPGSVSVKVESFGSQQQRDSLFENYDAKCEARIRSAFRLPPLLVGRAADFTYACYSEDTETLTDVGWITYDQFVPGMKIATVNPSSGVMEYRDPISPGPLVYDIDDDIYHIKSAVVDIMVTSNHTMLYRVSTDKYNVAPIEDMVQHNRVTLLAAPKDYHQGTHQDKFVVPNARLLGGTNAPNEVPVSPIDMNLFLTWLGCVIADGSIASTNYTITIGASKPRKVDFFATVIDKMEAHGFNVYRYAPSKVGKVDFSINNKGLNTWLRNNCGTESGNKQIPDVLMTLPKSQLARLFNALMECDGTYDTRPGRTSMSYSTVSKKLADQVQTIALILGHRAKVSSAEPGETSFGVKTQYRVDMVCDQNETVVMRDSNISIVPYKGKVYCFSVPNGIFVTRRNGRVAIQGNTAYASYVVAEAQVFQPERDEFDTIINSTIMRELSSKYLFKSKPLWVMDISNQLKAIELAKDLADKESLIESLNKLVGLSMMPGEDKPVEPPTTGPFGQDEQVTGEDTQPN